MSIKLHFLTFFVCFILSFGVKIMYVDYTDNWDKGGAPDTTDFLEVSDGILKGKESPSASYDLTYYPVFPLYLAGMRTVFGDDFLLGNKRLNLRLIHIGIYSFITYLVFVLAYHLYSIPHAMLASLFYLFSFSTTFWSHYILTESLFTLFFILHLLFIILYMQHSRIWQALAALVFFFLACFTRPVLILFPVILIVWYFLKKTENPFKKQHLLIVILPVLFFVLWQWKNSQLNTQFSPIPLKSILRNNFNNIEKYACMDKASSSKDSIWYFSSPETFPNEWKQAGSFKKFCVTLRVFLFRFSEFWSPTLLGSHQTWRDSKFILAYTGYYLLIFGICLIGLYKNTFREPSNLLLVLIFVYFTCVYTGTFRGGGIASRYRVPIEPLISIYASSTLLTLVRKR